MYQKFKWTILIPCLNEAETIGTVVTKIINSNQKIDYEILVADNGSSDGTLEILSKLPVRVISVQQKGYGAALRAGIREAQSEFIVMGDADDSYALENFRDFEYALDNGADLVVGNRFRGGIQKGAMPLLHRYLGNPVLSLIGRILFDNHLGDFHCGIRGFRKSKIEILGLNSDGMEFATEMIAKASRHNLQIVEIPTTLRIDGRTRPPHLRTWRDGWRHLKFMLAYSPKWALFLPGILATSIGATITGIDLFTDIVILGRSVEVMGVLLGSSLLIGGATAIIASDLISQLVFHSHQVAFSGYSLKLYSFLRSKIIFGVAASTQMAVTIWMTYIFSAWFAGNLDDTNQLTRIKYGLVFLFVTSVNLILLLHRIISSFIDKEFPPK